MRNSTDTISENITNKTFSTAEVPPMPDVTKQDIAADIKALRDTFKSGATKDIAQRKMLLRQLQRLMTEGEAAMKDAMWRDLHKHPTESFLGEIALVNAEIQDHLDYIDDWTKPEFALTNVANLPGLSYIHREPLGVACVIGTWNYPVNLLLTPLIAALSAGNCVLLRLPGDDSTRHLNNVLIDLLDEYMDRRFVRYVYGGVDETKAMLREQFDVIFATGGCFLGKIVAKAAAETLTPTILELGGKSPAIVDASADLALAARRIAWGAFSNAGQTCVRPDYVLVDAKVGDAFVAALEATISQFYGADVKASDSYGRIINDRSFERLHAVLDADRSSVTFGGASDATERFIGPTLLNFQRDFAAFESSKAMEAELFGPLLPIYYYAEGKLDEPIAFVAKNDKPLALYVFTTNNTTSKRVTRDTSAGSMVVNDTMMQLTNPHIPFGGVGTSGMGAYHGRFGFEAFSHRKPVLHKYSLLDLPARYAPYSPATERVLRIVQYPFSRTFWRSLKFAAYAIALAVIMFGVKAASLDVKLARYVLANADERKFFNRYRTAGREAIQRRETFAMLDPSWSLSDSDFDPVVYTAAAVVALVSGYMLFFRTRARATHRRIVHGDSKLNTFVAEKLQPLVDRYAPTWWTNGHMQIVLTFLVPQARIQYRRQILTLRDGGHASLDWAIDPLTSGSSGSTNLPADAPIVVILHGLTGCSASMRSLCAEAFVHGYRPVVFNKRGHGGLKLATPKLQAFGCVQDLQEGIAHIEQAFPSSRLFGIGFSAGSGLLVSYLGETGDDSRLDAGVLISPGYNAFDLFCRGRINRLYDFLMTHTLKQLLQTHKHELRDVIDISKAMQTTSIRAFDEAVYMKIHGFSDIETYWLHNNPTRAIHNIQRPSLCVNAWDDPVCTKETILYDQFASNPLAMLIETESGSHCAFYEGSNVLKLKSWANTLAMQYLDHVRAFEQQQKQQHKDEEAKGKDDVTKSSMSVCSLPQAEKA